MKGAIPYMVWWWPPQSKHEGRSELPACAAATVPFALGAGTIAVLALRLSCSLKQVPRCR